MNRYVAAGLAAVVAAAGAGCGDGKTPPPAAPASQLPNASEMFDKKAPPDPPGGKVKPPGAG